MAARDYTWLQAAVKSWTHRSDLTTLIPDFVLLAEERMSADLDARGMESLTMLPTVAGAPSIALTSDVIEIRSIAVPNYAPLDYLSADRFNDWYDSARAGTPRHYTVIGDAVYLGPVPDAVYQLAVSARRALPPLADAVSGTNWLIVRNPSLYLAATMCEAMTWMRDDEGLAVWQGKYQVALNTANSTADTAGQLVARPDTTTP